MVSVAISLAQTINPVCADPLPDVDSAISTVPNGRAAYSSCK